MSSEETGLIEKLEKATAAASQKTALKRIAEYLEECHILNLPISGKISSTLEAFSKSNHADASAKATANGLMKKYRL